MAQCRDSLLRFRNVQLLKGEILGTGSYGLVCKALCDNLICAAKVLHQDVFNPKAQSSIAHRRDQILPIRNFEQEIEILSSIKHPNVVQYLGMHHDPDTGVPILLMELMDYSLTQFLEQSADQLPFHKQVNLCHDVAMALSFLHLNNIIHRDLSSNNVLLIGSVRAKVTDFGIAKFYENIGDPTPCSTKNPGSDPYMPPEAKKSPARYTDKLDCFSFGVAVIQILTRKFPNPGNAHKEIKIQEGNGARIVLDAIPEVQRRQNHIRKIDSNHPLLSIALACLKDNDIERPAVSQVCTTIAMLKNTLEYNQSLKEMEELLFDTNKQRTIPGADIPDETISKIKNLQLENWQLKQTLLDKDEEIRLLKSQSEASKKARDEMDKRIQELRVYTQHRDESVKLIWREGQKVPREICRGCDPVVDNNNVVYFKPYANKEVYAYIIATQQWSQLPKSVSTNCSLAIIESLLTTIGGCLHGDNYSNELISLTNGHKQAHPATWTKEFPPMKIGQCSATTLCTETFLVVAGGVAEKVLKAVEVMRLATREWSTVADLPIPIYGASLVASDDHLYIVGGSDKDGDPLRTVFKSSKSIILPEDGRLSKKKAWKSKKIPNIPVNDATCVLFHGHLLTVGGMDDYGKATHAIHMYTPSRKRWEVVSRMSIPRSECFVTVLHSTNEIIVAGGYTEKSVTISNLTDEVEIAIVVT